MSQCTYFKKYITDISLKMMCVGNFVKHTLCSLHLTKINFVTQNIGKITLPMGQSKFSYELMFWLISIENGGKQKKIKIP